MSAAQYNCSSASGQFRDQPRVLCRRGLRPDIDAHNLRTSLLIIPCSAKYCLLMKLRRLPEDFQVDEQTAFHSGPPGPYAVYRLTKRGIGTPEAIEEILRSWNLPRRRIAYGGLKDRHAVTTQHVTIHHGPHRSLRTATLHLEFLGTAARAFTAGDIDANRFHLVLRSLTRDELDGALAALPDIQRTGLPNYFDDQRFGSVTSDGEFVAAAWLKRDYERSLWLAFAAPTPFDQRDEREQKQLLRDHWGDWPACKAALARSHRRSVITFLADRPGDFKGAWARVRQDLRSLYLSAFQSQLWNQMAGRWIASATPHTIPIEFKTQILPFPSEVPAEQWAQLQDIKLPLPSGREQASGPIAELLNDVLKQHKLETRDLRVRYPKDSFFSKGWRHIAIPMLDLKFHADRDELDPDHHKLELDFQLPRGSYATILVKRLMLQGDDNEGE
ncbi:MAG: tRNA pseudouridine(13) synthase TruD [Planctomycetaceae bacterium]|nr:tRNA pseudouridine(13) synthase TruD [Planctomycetaceae bacterium]